MSFTLQELIKTLTTIQEKIGPDALVDLLVEVDQPKKCQYQYPINDVGVSVKHKMVILMHEKWTGQD
jgi:hypothetical protein